VPLPKLKSRSPMSPISLASRLQRSFFFLGVAIVWLKLVTTWTGLLLDADKHKHSRSGDLLWHFSLKFAQLAYKQVLCSLIKYSFVERVHHIIHLLNRFPELVTSRALNRGPEGRTHLFRNRAVQSINSLSQIWIKKAQIRDFLTYVTTFTSQDSHLNIVL
jgi:hypothetical protein